MNIPDEVAALFDAIAKKGTVPDPRLAKCRECKYMQEQPGNHHVQCAYPDGKVYFEFILSGPPVAQSPAGDFPMVAFNPHGIRHGWASWPIDFDPIWLWWCWLYVKKEEPK